jgi:hypothetical protein
MINNLYNGKMWNAQQNLKPLPVPKLEHSCKIFLESVEPLVNEEEFEKTKELCKELINSKEGQQLQKLLEERAAKCNADAQKSLKDALANKGIAKSSLHPDGLNYPNTHWLEQWWEKLAYLAWPETLIFSNVFQIAFNAETCKNPIERAAGSAVGILDFRDLLLAGNLPMEPAGIAGQFLCNAQQLRILGTNRFPGETEDRLFTDHTTNHICVNFKGYWYSIQVLQDANRFDLGPSGIISIDDLIEELKFIEKDAVARSRILSPVAVLTATDRPVWAKNRLQLLSVSEYNAESIRTIETAIFHLVFSEMEPKNYAEALNALHHGNNCREIWMDKCISIVVFKNGVSGIHIEHSAADAVVPARLAIHGQVYCSLFGKKGSGYTAKNPQDLKKFLAVPQTPFRGPTTWKGIHNNNLNKQRDAATPFPWKKVHEEGTHRLDIALDSLIIERINEACNFVDEILATSQIVALCLSEAEVGNISRIKALNVAPDSFFQMVLQLAYARDQPQDPVPATYETAMTRSFLHGRTETIRTQSKYSKIFATQFDNPGVSVKHKREAFLNAANHHREYTKLCVQGNGCDRHLLGLRMLAVENKIPMPKLFTSQAYAKSTAITLSTSQMPWGVCDHPGFPAPGVQAYGVCYRFVVTGGIIATVVSRSGCKEKNAQRFCKVIEKSAVDLLNFLEATQPSKL